jgi:hypothetical protein
MGYKKFLLIPLLIITYLFLWPLSLLFIPAQQRPPEIIMSDNMSGGGFVERLGIGESVTVQVTRPYLFGLIELPVYINGKNIGIVHDIFFTMLLIIFIMLLIYEFHLKGGEYDKVERGWESNS